MTEGKKKVSLCDLKKDDIVLIKNVWNRIEKIKVEGGRYYKTYIISLEFGNDIIGQGKTTVDVLVLKQEVKSKTLIYLASPYSHEDPQVRWQRYNDVTQLTSLLMLDNFHVFSPITASFHLALYFQLQGDWDFWKEKDIMMLKRCDMMVVFGDWKESKGVNAEIKIAEKMMPVVYCDGAEYDDVVKKIMDAMMNGGING